jgi:hypothetical protein
MIGITKLHSNKNGNSQTIRSVLRITMSLLMLHVIHL